MDATTTFLIGIAVTLALGAIGYFVRRNVDKRIDDLTQDYKDLQKNIDSFKQEMIDKRHALRNEFTGTLLEEGKERLISERAIEERLTRRIEHLESKNRQ